MIKKNKKMKMTIDKLAFLMQAGFIDLDKKVGSVKKSINKKIEEQIDKLADSTAKGFEGVDKKFEQMEKRFEQVDKRFDQVEGKINGIDNRLDTFAINRVKHEDFSVLEKRVKKLERV